MKRPGTSWRSRLANLVAFVAMGTTLVSGCFSGNVGEPGGSCQSTRQYFLTDVWGPVMGRTCITCHGPGGQADLAGAHFHLVPSSYPGFVDTNLANIAAVANILYDINGTQRSELLVKPLGLASHGGGTVITEGSSEYDAIATLLQRMHADSTGTAACPDYGTMTAPSGVVLLDWPATLRKSSIDLLGRLPTAAETAAVTDQDSFEATLATMIEDPAFYSRWDTAFNDLVLTNRFVSGDGCDQRALNLVNSADFPNRGAYGSGGGSSGGLDCCNADRMNAACTAVRANMLSANNAIASEPVNLFDHILRNNRPYSEIVTANYVMVNPQSAHIYGLDSTVSFGGSYDPTQLVEAQIAYTHPLDSMGHTEQVNFPHAGVLTTAAFISRHTTTDTNRNRHRARMVQDFFLATDILKIGERPLDPTASAALVEQPTLNYAPCRTCHQINDPIAGAFRGFVPDGPTPWTFDPHDPWYTDMAPPGFAGENMPGASYGTALQWLGSHIAQDGRFVTSAVQFVYTGLTGHTPLEFPTDATDPHYAARSRAWNEQDAIFRAIGRRFAGSNMNLKTAIIAMVESPLYRAVAGPMTADAERLASLDGLGTARQLTPELLSRRIRAVVGFPWVKDYDHTQEWLTTDFYLPYGGINSDTIITRATDPSGIIVNLAQRMAIEVACHSTAYDFSQAQGSRRFFTTVETNTVPESAGHAVPDSVALIRQTIAHLHSLVLGENIPVTDPEVDRTYNLFLDTWHEVTTPASGMTAFSTDLPGACQAQTDPITNMPIPMGQQITSDPTGTVRAWMAVMTYLFSDYKFIYE